MTRLTLLCKRTALALGLSVAVTGGLGAQTSACLPVDGYATTFRLSAQTLLLTTDSVDVARRTRLQLPAIDTGKIAYVSDPKICAALVSAINAYMRSPKLVARVYVLDLGTVYLAEDPDARAGEWTPAFSVTHRGVVVGNFSH